MRCGAPELFDLQLLGQTWLRRAEGREHILATYPSSVYLAMQIAGVIDEPLRKGLGRNIDLINLAVPQCQTVRGKRRPYKREILQLAHTTDKLLIVLVVPAENLQFARLFGPKGYRCVISDVGMAHADRVAQNYASVIDPERFISGAWAQLKDQMRAAGSQDRQSTGHAPPSGVSGTAPSLTQLPQARVAEADFEWGGN